VIGLSILSGAHVPLCEALRAELERNDLGHLLWIVGGNIPQRDVPTLAELGVDAVFPTGSSFQDIVDFIHAQVRVAA
jgi:methylmalonyl-CoA mutase C-terminal domain/subunit